MVSAIVSRGLEDAGLKRFIPHFQHLSDVAFAGLMMSDYASHGVTDLEDKQRLYRFIKQLHGKLDAAHQSAAAMQDNKPNTLLDLDENDGDLLSDVRLGVHLVHLF